MKINRNAGEVIAFILCAIAFLAMMFAISIINRTGIENLTIGNIHLGVINIPGILTAFQMLICIIMVCINFHSGTILAICMMLFSLIGMCTSIFVNKNLSCLPGICTILISFTAVSIISHQLSLREKEAATDHLTGLKNRRGLFAYLSTRVRKNVPFSLIYIDLDDFKNINDAMSHKIGDDVLCQIAKRITDTVGKLGTVGRLGGDEFVIAIPESRIVDNVCKEILDSVCKEIKVDDNGTMVSCYVTASIGISSFPKDSTHADELLKLADIAMYYSKNEGKNKFVKYDKAMSSEALRQAYLEKLIKEGLDKDLFYLVFQPQYESSTKKLRGFETLLRLKNHDGTNISPAEFIPAAEKTDLIIELDNYVIKKSLQTFCYATKSAENPFTVSINVSAKNICSSDFAQRVKEMVEETGFNPLYLEIEITEYCLLKSLDTAVENLSKLKEMGIKIALDDFGTGYASLSYLSNLPVDLLKIDKSFIDDIETDKVSNDFVTAVISMGHILGCEVISEGVETEAQIRLLHEHDCDYIQGYVWGKPMEYDEAVKLC